MAGFLIVGIGNPGQQYANTRHNLGFMVLDELASQEAISFEKESGLESYLGRAQMAGGKLFLLKPQTFVNNSGLAVAKFLKHHVLDLSQILVVFDDVSLPFGHLRVKAEGGSGGHNGMKSLIQALGSQEFPRLRMGIGSPARPEQMVDYVLGEFDASQKKDLALFVQEGAECCRRWVQDGIKTVMDQFNQRKKA